jgi:hypothetical protein
MNDAGTLPTHMLEVRELTAEAFAPYGEVIAPLRTGGQGSATGHNPETSSGEAKLVLGEASRSWWIMHLRECWAQLPARWHGTQRLVSRGSKEKAARRGASRRSWRPGRRASRTSPSAGNCLIELHATA